MDNQEARFILQSRRPGGADAGDPHFDEALAQANRVPELASWFACDQALDATLAARLKEVPVPAGLRERLLLEQQQAEALSPAPAPLRRLHSLLALAAALILLATVAVVLWQRPASGTDLVAFRHEMIANICGQIRLSHQSAEVAELIRWLAEQRNVSGITIPAALQSRPGIGCRTWLWKGQPVGLICFLTDAHQAVHFFVVDRATVKDLPADLRPTFAVESGWTTATWTEGDKLYVLAGQADESTLAKLL